MKRQEPMTISQLVARLNELMKEEGDLPVYFYDGEAELVSAVGANVYSHGYTWIGKARLIDVKHVKIEWPDTSGYPI